MVPLDPQYDDFLSSWLDVESPVPEESFRGLSASSVLAVSSAPATDSLLSVAAATSDSIGSTLASAIASVGSIPSCSVDSLSSSLPDSWSVIEADPATPLTMGVGIAHSVLSVAAANSDSIGIASVDSILSYSAASLSSPLFDSASVNTFEDANVFLSSALADRVFSTQVDELVAAEQVVSCIQQMSPCEWEDADPDLGQLTDAWTIELWHTALLSTTWPACDQASRVEASIHLADKTRARSEKRAARAERKAAREANQPDSSASEPHRDAGLAASVFYRRSLDDEEPAA